MNVVKIMGIISIFTVSHCLQSMEKLTIDQLSEIEKQLVLREAARRGKDVMERKIYKQRDDSEMQWNKKNRIFSFTKPPILKIETTFSPNQVDTDPIAKNIFDKIHEIEKESGYYPEIGIFQKEDKKIVGPTNLLGNNTRYHWVKEDVVEVKSHFEHWTKEALLEVIKNNKD